LTNNSYREYGEIMPSTTTPNDELLNIGDAAALSGHSVATYRCYRANGIGPKSCKCGRYVKYWHSDVLAWMDVRRYVRLQVVGVRRKYLRHRRVFFAVAVVPFLRRHLTSMAQVSVAVWQCRRGAPG
jgi:predicted DNA-binding transcriptional regulator AlpA